MSVFCIVFAGNALRVVLQNDKFSYFGVNLLIDMKKIKINKNKYTYVIY